MGVSKRLRYEILRRDNHTCRYCGAHAPDVTITVDHVTPTALGGTDEPNNLVAACRDCNAGKSATSPDAPLVEQVDEQAARWARAMGQVVEQRAALFAAEREHTDWFSQMWGKWADAAGNQVPKDGNWESSILRFMGGGLSRDFLARAVRTAMGNDRLRGSEAWRYFCGICWRELDAIRDGAAALMAGPGLEFLSEWLDQDMRAIREQAGRSADAVEKCGAQLIAGMLISASLHVGEGSEPVAFIRDHLRFVAEHGSSLVDRPLSARILTRVRDEIAELLNPDSDEFGLVMF